MTGQYYEEFEVGETISHEKRRTISESDNQRFCDMTMNQQPLHLDEAFVVGEDDRLVCEFDRTALSLKRPECPMADRGERAYSGA